MVQQKPALPSGHGELLARPPVAQWPELALANAHATSGWALDLAGRSYDEVRRDARRSAVASGTAYCERLGIPVGAGDPDGLVIASGHQPELYHPGVWAKVFLLQRVAAESRAMGVDLVVDTDGFERVGVTVPCFGGPRVERCHADLARGGADSCFACTPAPDRRVIDEFVDSTTTMLESLPAPSVGRHFGEFAQDLVRSAGQARSLAELVTAARRRYERAAGTDYLEVAVSELSESDAFRVFFATLAMDAERFAVTYNRELEGYREARGIRTTAQPVPDLSVTSSAVELPFWALHEGHRSSVSVQRVDGSVLVLGGPEPVVLADDADPSATLGASGLRIAPKALALTMFVRMFLCDLFIHGVGGGAYDQVTDGIIREYFGVEPPRFVVASLTMFLPLGAHVVTDDEVQAATERLNRFEHNPDALICDAEFESTEERDRALQLVREKAELVSAMNAPDADRKSLGRRIKEVNAQLRDLLQPIGAALADQKQTLEAQRSASEILTDRTYAFCFWSPQEVADKVS